METSRAPCGWPRVVVTVVKKLASAIDAAVRRPAFDPDPGQDHLELGRRLDRDLAFGQEPDGLAGRRQR